MSISNSILVAGMVKAPNTLDSGAPLISGSHSDIAAVLSSFAELGFENVEVHQGWVPFPDFDVEQSLKFRKALTVSGVAAPSFTVARRSILDPERGAENLDYTLKALEVVSDFEAQYLCVGLHPELTMAQLQAEYFWMEPGLSDPTDSESWAQAVSGFQRIADRAKELGIEISLEIYEDTLLGASDSSLRLIQEIDRTNVGLNPDLGNLIRLDRAVEDWEEWLAKVMPFSNYWHVKNYTRVETKDGFRTEPSTMEEGFIDYLAAFRMANDIGFSGPIICEHYSHDPMPVLRANLEFTKRVAQELTDSESKVSSK